VGVGTIALMKLVTSELLLPLSATVSM